MPGLGTGANVGWLSFFFFFGLKAAEGRKENQALKKKKMSWAVLVVAFCGFLYGPAFTEDWFGFGDDHPEYYLYPFLAWAVVEACRTCCCRHGGPHCQAMHPSPPTSPPTTSPSPAMEKAFTKQRKQKAMVAAMKAKHSPSRPAPLSLQEKWANGYNGPL